MSPMLPFSMVLSEVYGAANWSNSEDIDPKTFHAYLVKHVNAKVNLKAVGRTLYTSAKSDVGLTLVSGAPWSSCRRTLTATSPSRSTPPSRRLSYALEDSDNYKGVIAAALNDKGTAEFIVLSSATQLTDNSKDDDNKKANVKASTPPLRLVRSKSP